MGLKSELLNDVDKDYLLCAYSNMLNGHNRLNSLDKTIVEKLTKKLTLTQVKKIHLNYILGIAPEKTGIEIKKTGDLDDMIKILSKQFGRKNVFLEVPVNGKNCDAIILNGKNSEITAVEIKSSRDRLNKAIEQCKNYLDWADFVYLFIDGTHRNKIVVNEFFKNNKVGILVYNYGLLNVEKFAKNNKINLDNFLRSFSLVHLLNVAKYYNIPTLSKREELIKLLKSNLTFMQIKRGIIKSITKSFYSLSDF